ncbi:uncharacterized protein LOC115999364 [Ipomoea triloba]|uniref:uncharacterized protein LOC115999364 n=1 Tax=Ipomoea triloba TaxID=35885 RepID=UPI00125DABED|nr:uncharacterized protein LOC115999364 [Ipomoea triloba]
MKGKYAIAGINKDGWMVLRDEKNNEDVFLLNVYSLDTMQLPKLELVTHYAYLSSTPDDSDCYIVMVNIGIECCSISACKMGDKKFVTQQLDLQTAIASLISFGGNMYALRHHNFTLVHVELRGQSIEFEELVSDDPFEDKSIGKQNSFSRIMCYIGESCDGIILVVKYFFGVSDRYIPFENIRVFRADLSTKKWVEMETIGEHTIFLGSIGNLICIRSDNVNVKKNCIYFTERKDRKLYVFDMEDKSITVNLPCPNVTIRSHPLWIL